MNRPTFLFRHGRSFNGDDGFSGNPLGRSSRQARSRNPLGRSARPRFSQRPLTLSPGVADFSLALPMHKTFNQGRSSAVTLVALWSAFGASLLWAYWPTLCDAADRWSHDPRYAHGYLVPVFAAVLLWLRRQQFRERRPVPTTWGVLLVVTGAALRLAGAHFYVEWLASVALLPSLAGLCLLLGGWRALRWSWPAIAFLAFMLPLPYRVEVALAQPLQRLATVASTYVLQALGLPALAEGNVIILNRGRIGVVDACSGLSTLLTFFALSAAVAFVVRRPLWEKCVLVLSAIPIALIANVVRIAVTGILQEKVGGAIAATVYHELSGWLMIPLALGLLWLEFLFLSHLFIEPVRARPVPIELSGARAARRAPADRGATAAAAD